MFQTISTLTKSYIFKLDKTNNWTINLAQETGSADWSNGFSVLPSLESLNIPEYVTKFDYKVTKIGMTSFSVQFNITGINESCRKLAPLIQSSYGGSYYDVEYKPKISFYIRPRQWNNPSRPYSYSLYLINTSNFVVTRKLYTIATGTTSTEGIDNIYIEIGEEDLYKNTNGEFAYFPKGLRVISDYGINPVGGTYLTDAIDGGMYRYEPTNLSHTETNPTIVAFVTPNIQT